MTTLARRLAPAVEAAPTTLFVGFALLGLGVEQSIHWVSGMAGVIVALTVLTAPWARPVMLAMNLHFATVPPLFFVLVATGRGSGLSWLGEHVHETVTGAAALAVVLAAFLGRVPVIWRVGLVGMVAATMVWAFAFGDNRLLSVGLPAIMLSQALNRARAAAQTPGR